ncbi:MAG: DUF1517 domain-containing protein [Pseudanabaena sp.]|jgi:uncharacterized membrane protein
MRRTKLQFLTTALLTFSIVQTINFGFIDRLSNLLIQNQQQAQARSSAGRSGGGSFKRSSPSPSKSPSSSKSSPSPKASPQSTPSRSSSPSHTQPSSVSPNQDNERNSFTNQPSSYSNNRSSSSYYYNSKDIALIVTLLVWLVVLIVIFVTIYWILWKLMLPSQAQLKSEFLNNNLLTITKLQVALLAQAREIQSRLTELSLGVDTSTPEGLLSLMQDSAIAVMRTPENWTHVAVTSQSLPREQAETLFNQLVVEERAKFSQETLVNVNGRVALHPEVVASPDKDPSAYIVVTLLIATEHDQPLLGQKITSVTELHKALDKITAIAASQLLVFELMWTPQAATDSLTYDELLTEYSNMIQI